MKVGSSISFQPGPGALVACRGRDDYMSENMSDAINDNMNDNMDGNMSENINDDMDCKNRYAEKGNTQRQPSRIHACTDGQNHHAISQQRLAD